MLNRISHLGIAVKDLESVLKFYSESLGLVCQGQEEVPSQKVKVAFLPLGETNIELLESTEPDGPIAKFIENRGEGIHHIAIEVDDIEQALAELKAKGVRLIDEVPRVGAHDAKIAFIHPKASHGVLIELCQYAK
ncbi:MAG TPA: methylmalonyl-CoA epimerase [Bacillota bacterium]|nr:methylmalonyl-CoA epimerase [Bacillota bacterium]